MENLVAYPFVRCKAEVFDGEGMATIDSWRPGCEARWEDCYGNSEWFADAMGTMVLTEVSRHKPGKYPERVFYVRQFVDPDGTRFGKTNLRMTTAQRFKTLCAGYSHEYQIDDQGADHDGQR